MIQTNKTYTESYIILKKLNLLNSIPADIYQLIKNNYDDNIKFYYIDGLPLEYQPLSKETKNFLIYLYIKYICKSKKEINQYKEIIIENTKRKETIKREKYNPNNIFKNR